jgi:hypothetical protein
MTDVGCGKMIVGPSSVLAGSKFANILASLS